MKNKTENAELFLKTMQACEIANINGFMTKDEIRKTLVSIGIIDESDETSKNITKRIDWEEFVRRNNEFLRRNNDIVLRQEGNPDIMRAKTKAAEQKRRIEEYEEYIA